ncbi:p21-C-terminal region-binding protein-domain-containing protein [Phanerochaete sordida]|uniref:Protein BCP1 n=1 Tax=Phanerochaete sordida TaxID=48140 RepID=A0A9P3GQ22_9APHY|nr:p21-C-terminal region-binding protein-domain-containing protein [Phanerochaete sordida]
MSKRKQEDQELESDDGDVSLVDVDFDFFDPNPEVDYLAIKRLANQLFQGDAEQLQVHDLTDLILSQPRVGTTIKCDGKESDPYAVLTVLNLQRHQDRPCIKAITEYALKGSGMNDKFHAALHELLGPAGLQSANHVGLVFSERLINMPVQLMPPTYRMLEEELRWAVEDNEPFRFSHYLFISQTYRLSSEEAAELEATASRSKRQKGASKPKQEGVTPVHPEDEEIAQFATHIVDFPYTNTQPRDNESFGLDTSLRMMLVPAERFPQIVQAIAETYPAPS